MKSTVCQPVTNSDQENTFTAGIYVNCLAEHGIRQSVGGQGAPGEQRGDGALVANVKTKWLRLQEYETPRQLRNYIAQFVELYNNGRLRESLDYRTPAECYYEPFAKAA